MRARKMPAVSRGGGNRFEPVAGRRVRRAAKAVLALLAAMAMLAPGAAFAADGDRPAVEFNRLADENTSGTYAESLGDNNSTRYAGRVWNDKTVSSGDMTFTGTTSAGQGSTYTVKRGNSDFLVTYSTLATSQTVIGQHPTDTVFILDFSTSMTWGYRIDHVSVAQDQSRIQAMVESVNSAIDTLAHANGQNRIGIAVFNGASTELVPLTTADDILQKVDNSQYLEIYDYDYTPGEDGGRADIRSNINGRPTSTGGGTNIQAGLFTGMRMLANSSDTTVDVAGTTVTRIPNVVLMSDGAPTTFSSSENATYYVGGDHYTGRITNDTELDSDQAVNSGSWWSSSSGEAIGSGNNDDPDSADGFVTLLMAAYYKNAINDHYYPGGDDSANIYTIGFGTDVQTSSMVAMANLVLDPATHLDQHTDYAEVDAVSDAWSDYVQGEDPIVRAPIGKGNNNTLVDYHVEHPNDDDNDPTSLAYPTQAFSADDGDQLNQIFQQIASMITEQAKAPTQTDGSLTSSGHITYTDPIGQYMQIDSVKALLWSGTLFDKVGSQIEGIEGNVTTYTFRTQKDEDTISSPINGNLYSTDIITVRVETDNQTRMQTLTVRIPAAAIPLRVNTITLDNDGGVESNESNNAYPLRLVYGVSLNDDVVENGVVNTDVVSQDYIKDHSSGDGTVRFYTNLYSGNTKTGADGSQTTVGDANVTFEPADDNPFYYVQENTPLYVGGKFNEETGTLTDEQPATGNLDPNETYYFQISYYEDTQTVTRWVARPGSQLQLEGYVKPTGVNDQLEFQKGSPRLGNLTDLSRAKEQNTTGTADQRLYPTLDTSDPDAGSFCIYLGNNGVLSVPTTQPVTIEAGQALAVAKRLRGNDLSASEADDNNFKFTLTPQATTPADGMTAVTADEAAEKLKPSDTTDGDTADGILHFRNDDATKDDDGVAADTMHPITAGLTFTAADAGKTFTYVVAEVVPNPKPAGYLFDTTLTHTVTYTVALDNGRLTVKASVDNGPVMELPSSGGNQVPTVTFDNTYVAPVSALPLTGGDATARNLILAGGGILLLAGVAWLLARRHRV